MKIIIREQKEWSRRTFDFGWGNGYVLIPKDHPLHGTYYDDINIDVHGGLTFSDLVDANMIEKWELDAGDEGKWCVGFDTAHYSDNLIDWPKERVQEEAERMCNQLKEIK